MPVITTSCTSGSPAAMIFARSGPTLTKVPVDELEVLGDAAVEHEAAAGIVRVHRLGGVAGAEEAFVVEASAVCSGARQ